MRGLSVVQQSGKPDPARRLARRRCEIGEHKGPFAAHCVCSIQDRSRNLAGQNCLEAYSNELVAWLVRRR